MLWYSLEAPREGASDEYHNMIFFFFFFFFFCGEIRKILVLLG